MLSLDEPLSLSGLTVFRDFNDRALFYYLPDSPQLTVEGGDPLFSLLVYRRSAGAEGDLGGGFLTMTADLAVSSGKLGTVRNELSRKFGVTARLAALPVEAGSVRVSLLDSDSGDDESTSGFVERILASGTPSLYGDQRAVFTSKLSQDGATLMQAAMQDGGATPVVLVYELTYKGLLPAYECKIKISFEQTYEYLRNRRTFSSLWVQADVDNEMEELVKRGAIEVSEIVYHVDEPEQQAQRRRELLQLAKDLATWSFFSPGLQPGRVLPENQRDLFAPPPNFQQLLAQNRQAVSTAITGNGTAAGQPSAQQASASAAPERPSGAAMQATSDPPRQQRQTQEPPGANALSAWEQAGRPHATWQLKTIEQRERQDIEFNLNQVSAAQRTISPQGQIRLLGNEAKIAEQIKVVSLDADFFKKIEGAVTTSAPIAELGVSSMVVEVRYGFDEDGSFPKDTAEVRLAETGASGNFEFWLDGRGTEEIEYRVTLNHVPGSAIGAAAADETSDWVRTTLVNLDIDPREVSKTISAQVETGAIDWELVRQVQATLSYEDASAQVEGTKTFKLERDAPSQLVLVRPESEQKVSVAATFLYADGGDEVVTFEREGTGLLLVNQPADTTKTVTTILADPLGRYAKVTVQFAPGGEGDPETARTIELQGDLAKETWSFRPEDPSNRTFRYKVTYFVGGAVREEAWVASTAEQVVLGDRADDVLDVNVSFLGSLQSGGMKALRLKLVYPDAPEWADGDFEKAYVATDSSATSQPLSWRVPMADRGKRNYKYELQWVRDDNSRLEVGPIQTSAETLMIDPLAPEEAL